MRAVLAAASRVHRGRLQNSSSNTMLLFSSISTASAAASRRASSLSASTSRTSSASGQCLLLPPLRPRSRPPSSQHLLPRYRNARPLSSLLRATATTDSSSSSSQQQQQQQQKRQASSPTGTTLQQGSSSAASATASASSSSPSAFGTPAAGKITSICELWRPLWQQNAIKNSTKETSNFVSRDSGQRSKRKNSTSTLLFLSQPHQELPRTSSPRPQRRRQPCSTSGGCPAAGVRRPSSGFSPRASSTGIQAPSRGPRSTC